jgi:hypothetical protein
MEKDQLRALLAPERTRIGGWSFMPAAADAWDAVTLLALDDEDEGDR